MDHQRDGLAETLARVAGGEREAWGRLCERIAPQALGIARALVGDGDAEDACHEVFLRLHEQAWRFRAGDDPDAHAEAWIRRLAANCCLNWRRARHRRRRGEAAAVRGSEVVSDPPMPAGGDEASRRRDVLDALGERFSAADRSAIVLRFWEDRSHADAAAQLGGSVVSARVRLSRALARLRGRLRRRGIADVDAALGLVAIGAQVTGVPSAIVVPDALRARLLRIPDERALRAPRASVLAAVAASLVLVVVGAAQIGWHTHGPSARPGGRAAAAPTSATAAENPRTSVVADRERGGAQPRSMGSEANANVVQSRHDVHLAVERSAGPSVTVTSAAGEADYRNGRFLQRSAVPSLRISWPAEAAAPPGHAAVSKGFLGKSDQVVTVYDNALPAVVREAVADLTVTERIGALDGAGERMYLCLCVERDGDRFVATLVPAQPLTECYGSRGVGVTHVQGVTLHAKPSTGEFLSFEIFDVSIAGDGRPVPSADG